MKVTGYETKISQIKAWLKTGSINVFGMPFAGKDTHCRELADLLDGVVVGSGDILRSKDTPSHIQEHIAKGFLAPMEEFLSIMLPYFSRQEFRGKPLILSSVGRWHGEEAGVLEASAESGHPLLVVIYLKITIEEMRQRWSIAQHTGDRGARDDDAEHILDTRLEEFETKTKPVIEFYRDQGMLIEIDGMKPKEQVLKNILDKLALHARRQS
jgi:adenylate kinase